MPKESRCKICTDPRARVAVAELRSQNVSYQQIASQLGLAKASVGRHVLHAGITRRDGAGTSNRKSPQAGRRRGGRCQSCGTLLDDPSPSALVKRAEKVLAFGEQIMQKAIDDEDFRLALQAVDRARASLEQLMKVHGLLQPEGAGATIDNRKQVIQVLAGCSEEELRALIGEFGKPAGSETIDATATRAVGRFCGNLSTKLRVSARYAGDF